MIDTIIINNLIFNEPFARRVLPYLKDEYFQNGERVVFNTIFNHFGTYNTLPTKETLAVDINNIPGLNENIFKSAIEVIEKAEYDKHIDQQWLVEHTEKFCQEKAIYNAIMESIQIIDDKKSKKDKGAIPEMLQEALGVSFNQSIGHDFFDNFEDRFKAYTSKEIKIPFDLEVFNKITKDGVSRKTLNIILAPTGVGKTLFMCHMAANNLIQGKKVLYITLEMSEIEISKRIDANLLDCPMDMFDSLPPDSYFKMVEKLRNKTPGKLVVKEFAPTTASTIHFRALLNELKLKKKFVPEIIYIDYINICASSRLKSGGDVNSYAYVKSIAEEVRSLAVEMNLPIISATQTNRSGANNSDIELTDTSESFGLPMTADFMFAVSTSEELEKLNQLAIKQLKNRYSDPAHLKRFVIGVDKSKMRLYNVENFSSLSKDLPKENDPKEQSRRKKMLNKFLVQ